MLFTQVYIPVILILAPFMLDTTNLCEGPKGSGITNYLNPNSQIVTVSGMRMSAARILKSNNDP